MRILRNPVAVVVTLGVAIIPSLYAWFNILANWDPYSSTGNLQVAVANEDKGTTSDLVGRLDAGKQVVTTGSAGRSSAPTRPWKACSPANTTRRSYCRRTSAQA
jgi:uncharacterized phage infection (PIP) family protein YhgE